MLVLHHLVGMLTLVVNLSKMKVGVGLQKGVGVGGDMSPPARSGSF